MLRNTTDSTLRITLDKVVTIIRMARESLGAVPNEVEIVPMDGEGALPSSEDYEEGLTGNGLFDYVDGLREDEIGDLLALAWLGRGDFTSDEWPEAQQAADDEIGDGDAIAEIIQDPLLPDDLIAGLEALGYDNPED